MMPPKSSLPPAAVEPAVPAKPVKPAGAVSKRPAWQRNPVFRFFSSVKLAIVLLIVVIIASAVGTVYESSFDAKVARAYVYGATWFNVWLFVLGLNLACAAFSRMPWKRHHTGFLITHLGIIVLMLGAVIGQAWGIEGTMTIFKGQPPNNQLIIDEHVLRLEENGNRLKALPDLRDRAASDRAKTLAARVHTRWVEGGAHRLRRESQRRLRASGSPGGGG